MKRFSPSKVGFFGFIQCFATFVADGTLESFCTLMYVWKLPNYVLYKKFYIVLISQMPWKFMLFVKRSWMPRSNMQGFGTHQEP